MKNNKITQEYKALSESVGFIDHSDFGKIEVSGSARISFLHSILTNDIKNLKEGDSCPAALLDRTGKVLMIMQVAIFCDSIGLLVEPGFAEKIMSLLNKFIIAEDVILSDVSKKYALFTIQGPKAREIVAVLSGSLRAKRSNPRPEIASVAQLPRNDSGNFIIMTIEAAWYGPQTYHLMTLNENKPKLLEKFSELKISRVGREVFEIRRIEAGIPRFGVDIDENILLSETGLEALVASETKGCYPGQEVVARIKTYGSLKRKMIKLVFEGKQLPKKGDKIYFEEKEVGWITSTCNSVLSEKGLALGYLLKGYFQPEKKVKIVSKSFSIEAKAVLSKRT